MKNMILTSLIIFEDDAGYSLRSFTPVLDVLIQLNNMEKHTRVSALLVRK
jgi:hypothetical protein